MARDIHHEIHAGLQTASPARLRFTRRAFQMLPKLDRPRILDVGCGRGGPTLELARLSNGEIVGLDIDSASLDEFSARIDEEGLSDRLEVVNGSMFEMDFPDQSFDIIWAEGSIRIVGLEKGFEDWRRLIRPDGFLVVHEMTWLQQDPPQEILQHWGKVFQGIGTPAEYIERASACGYRHVGHFTVPEDFWWLEYYGPLEERIQELRTKYAEDQEVQRTLDREQREVDLYKKYARWYGSAFLLMRKSSHHVTSV